MWLADLLSGYTIENTSFSPVDSFDLARLLGDGYRGIGIAGGSLTSIAQSGDHIA
jgi:hypothetical protein